MVYVSKDGTVSHSQPWNLERLISILFSIYGGVIFFFKSLFGLDRLDSSRYFRGSSASHGGGHGGGGGGGGRPDDGFGSRGQRHIRTMKDINPPTVGGCPGGSCGR